MNTSHVLFVFNLLVKLLTRIQKKNDAKADAVYDQIAALSAKAQRHNEESALAARVAQRLHGLIS